MLMGFLESIIIGILAGFLAGKVMKGGGFGCLWNLVLGLVGGLVGGWLFDLLDISVGGDIVGPIVTSTAGAVFVLWIASFFKK